MRNDLGNCFEEELVDRLTKHIEKIAEYKERRIRLVIFNEICEAVTNEEQNCLVLFYGGRITRVHKGEILFTMIHQLFEGDYD